MNGLISFQKKLSKDFIKHIENTKNLCIYKLGHHTVPKEVIFPNASQVTLINCSNTGIFNILYPHIFPNLNTVNYLSINSDRRLINRFSSDVKWVFPDKNYDFYNFMVESGYGKKDPEILKRYITNKKIIDGKNGFDISFEFDINVPFYGIVSGQWWQSQFYEYLVEKQNKHINESEQEIEERLLQKNKVMNVVDNIDFD